MLTTAVACADEPWLRHTIDASSQGADGVRLADVNGDNLMDIATGWEEGGIVRAYLHPSRGNERAKWPAVTVGKVKSPEDAVFADLDGDGGIDVISACEGNTRSLFVHWAPKEFLNSDRWKTDAFPVAGPRQSWMYTLPMQIDGVYGIDLMVGSKGDRASVGWLQSPANACDISAWRYHRLEDAGWIMSLIAADMDGDGDDDVLISDRKGAGRGIYWLERPASPAESRWPRHDIGGSDHEILFIAHGDLDQDGQLDVAASAKEKLMWFRRTEDTWKPHEIPLPSGVGTGKSVAICDVNADGKNDLVFSCENARGELSGMRWMSWEASPITGPWSNHEIAGSHGIKFDRVVPHDIDGDGDLDMICCEERANLGVIWYENPAK
ncbi:MAG: VCBS repeat-containing protein [Verrucomicrobiae bacterium]|nr:VCBS repeat-containing protein [Verrucomicrobiae bacterium]